VEAILHKIGNSINEASLEPQDERVKSLLANLIDERTYQRKDKEFLQRKQELLQRDKELLRNKEEFLREENAKETEYL